MKKVIKNIIKDRGPGPCKCIIICILAFALFSCDDGFKEAIELENITAENKKENPGNPVISFTSSSSIIPNEDENEYAINILLSPASEKTVSVTLSDLLTGTAQAGNDYNLIDWTTPERIRFNPGDTLKTVYIRPVQNNIVEESGKTIMLELSDSFNADLELSSHMVTILDDDVIPTVSFSASTSVTMDEVSVMHRINIVLSAPYGETVSVTVSDPGTGTASFGTDYTCTGWTSPQVISFNPLETLKTISITPIQDSIVEGSETINLELSSPVNAEPGIFSHTVIILDDDVLPTVSFSASTSVTANEDEVENSINIVLSAPYGETVSVTVSDLGTGTATYGSDYTLTSRSSSQEIEFSMDESSQVIFFIPYETSREVIFSPGETSKTISITPIQDSIVEGNETINLELNSPVNAKLGISSHTVTILDDDVLPTVSFSTSTSVTPNENEVEQNINIALSAPYGETVSVTVSDPGTGTATYGADYTRIGWTSPQVISFNTGETLKTISITPIQDAIVEGNETINLALSSAVNARLGNSSHVITIQDDDSYWNKVGQIATPRAGAATALYNNWLYIYGGEDSTGVRSDFWRYNLDTTECQSLSNENSGGYRAYATLVELDGKLYRFGGKDETGTLHDKKIMYYYDLSTNTWGNFDNSNTTGTWLDVRYSHVSVAIYDSINNTKKIYIHGGKDSSGGNLSDLLYFINLSIYKYSWTDVSLSTGGFSYRRSEHSAAVYNNNIYFFGGYDTDTAEYKNDLWKFDVNDESFSEVITTGTTIIPARGGIQITENGGKLYVFGGRNTTAVFNDLWEYSTTANKWTKISTAPFNRCFHTAIKYNNALYIYGGYYLHTSGEFDGSSEPKVYSSELWRYTLE